MSRVKTDLAGLGGTVGKILKEYADDVIEAMPDAVKKASKVTLKSLKANAAAKIGGTKYKTSFKTKTTNNSKNRMEITVYSSRYQVAHLLEHGHVIRNQYGVYGVTTARPHWAPAEQDGIEALEKEIERKVQEAG